MTTTSNSSDNAWVLEATIRTTQTSDPPSPEQLASLRTIALYDPQTRTWHARLGALDMVGLQTLQTLFDTARVYGTEVNLMPAPVPASWHGPVFTTAPDVAAMPEPQTDRGRRPLGQLPLA
ncbi:hypothetical protein AB0L75_30750 [Streptomyces sp. NPDC052101]|uniref:hypothetical protein n=1 Tax=Streptomyces sp. NPDC052101 TaxID=3155763 RepID=UPI00341CAFF3